MTSDHCTISSLALPLGKKNYIAHPCFAKTQNFSRDQKTEPFLLEKLSVWSSPQYGTSLRDFGRQGSGRAWCARIYY